MPTITRVQTVADALSKLRYEFKLNECTQRIEVNGDPITDGDEATIRVLMRGKNVINTALISDVMVSQAYQNSYHPVKEFLKCTAKKYDGKKHIAALSDCIKDTDDIFPMLFRHWLVGAVAKVMQAEQNPMLVMDGEQGLGKSQFSKWLCPLPDYFIESPVNPEDKDTHLRLASRWIWEVAELGATVRRSDRESLKFFITRGWVTVRPAYAKHDVNLPAMASLIGTVNDECGILADPTGSRRFLICHVESIDWSYKKQIDISQVWGEAYSAYLAGEDWRLSPDDERSAQFVNERYEMDDAIEGWLKKHYRVSPTNTARWIPTHKIVEQLYGTGAMGNRAHAITLGSCCRKLKLTRARRTYNGQQVWGFTGLILKKKKVDPYAI